MRPIQNSEQAHGQARWLVNELRTRSHRPAADSGQHHIHGQVGLAANGKRQARSASDGQNNCGRSPMRQRADAHLPYCKVVASAACGRGRPVEPRASLPPLGSQRPSPTAAMGNTAPQTVVGHERSFIERKIQGIWCRLSSVKQLYRMRMSFHGFLLG